jgi:hypothetical protein
MPDLSTFVLERGGTPLGAFFLSFGIILVGGVIKSTTAGQWSVISEQWSEQWPVISEQWSGQRSGKAQCPEQGLRQGSGLSAAAVSSTNSYSWEEELALGSSTGSAIMAMGSGVGESLLGSGAGETAVGSWGGSSFGGSEQSWATRWQSAHL